MFTPGFDSNTMLLTVRSQLDGSKIRLRFSNREGKQPYGIIQGTVQIEDGKAVPLSFPTESEEKTAADAPKRSAGKSSVDIPAGAEICSNVISADIREGDLITVRLAFSGKVMSGNGIEVPVIKSSKKGNFVNAPQFDCLMRGKPEAYHDTIRPIAAISSIEIEAADDTGAIVCFGDSITQQSRWVLPLTQMFAGCSLSIINKGIGGNRMLKDPMFKAMGMYGRRALDRYDRDAIQEAGVTAVVLALGTNDLGMYRGPQYKGGVTAKMLMEGNRKMAEKARRAGLKVYCATITPRTGVFGWKPEHEAERQKLNRMIRTSDIFDGILDFDQVLREASHPEVMDMRYDSGDHLHPGSLGGLKMAQHAYQILK